MPLGNWTIEDAARDTVERGLADALIVSGAGTGLAADLADVERVRRTAPTTKILLGSGTTLANVRDYQRAKDDEVRIDFAVAAELGRQIVAAAARADVAAEEIVG